MVQRAQKQYGCLPLEVECRSIQHLKFACDCILIPQTRRPGLKRHSRFARGQRAPFIPGASLSNLSPCSLHLNDGLIRRNMHATRVCCHQRE
eukprot:scaffold521729_cov48-Prasinocladus_malaysianus.AAC.1